MKVDPTSSSRGPSLYWRAKSTYHKKLMAFGPEGNGPVDPNEDTPNLRGSFWRPLMVPEDGGLVMQHSSGCPYKCKGCFKACLVSEDYLQKARAQKLLREQEQKRTADSSHRPTTLAHFKRKVKDARDIVNTALARSQPLYKMVHGDKEEHQSNPSERDKENCAEPSVAGNTDDISGVDTQGPIGGIAEDPTMQNVSGSVLNEEKNESGGVAKLSSGGGVGENGAVETRQAWMEEEKQSFPDSQ
nr:hypothetical protein BaRGS_021419 [Batillaria attramentaria]